MARPVTGAPEPGHALDAGAVLERLGSDATAGLSAHAAQRRAAKHGPNALPGPPRHLLAGLTASVALQAAVLYWPPLGGLFHTLPIALADLPLLVAVASTVLWAEELRKLVARRRAPAG